MHYNFFRYYDPGTGRYITADPIGFDGGINLFIYAQNSSVNLLDYNALKTTFTVYVSGAQVIGGFWGGTAVAKTECVNGKYYEAYYAVVGTGLGISAGLNLKGVKDAIQTALSQIDNVTAPTQFTTEHNIPPGYLSNLDLELLTVDWGFDSAKVADVEFSPYEGGRDIPTDPLFKGPKDQDPSYELQGGLFNIVAWQFFRTGLFENCCDQ